MGLILVAATPYASTAQRSRRVSPACVPIATSAPDRALRGHLGGVQTVNDLGLPSWLDTERASGLGHARSLSTMTGGEIWGRVDDEWSASPSRHPGRLPGGTLPGNERRV